MDKSKNRKYKIQNPESFVGLCKIFWYFPLLIITHFFFLGAGHIAEIVLTRKNEYPTVGSTRVIFVKRK